MHNIIIYIIVSAITSSSITTCAGNKNTQEFCAKDKKDCISKQNSNYRYIFYDVNPAEGFNLRRDVYMRLAVFIHKLNKHQPDNFKYKLVLPPWPSMYHWKSRETKQIPWSYFFDLKSMQVFAPVIEMYQFFQEYGLNYQKTVIDEIYILQHFEDMFQSGKFEEKFSIEKCNKNYKISYFGYKNITSNTIECLSFHGQASLLRELLSTSNARTIMFHHAEVALHDYFGDKTYWKARRSMRFNKYLVKLADEFREIFLNSTDLADKTVLPNDWKDERLQREAKGGPYLSVHLRRRDFAWNRLKQIPSIKHAAYQIEVLLTQLNLNTVFIASDAPIEEIEELRSHLKSNTRMVQYISPENSQILEGQLAIVDQIICSHGRYFVGTYESTFSFRIQEEREILGFPVETSFNRLCGDEETKDCQRTSMWKIVY